ncbi:MAG: helix-turn-helix domain-containing protein, partial [Mogibacterium sp.]|nr:helix-turn-helix domain-containing protein [Mogibacterium sp.]
ARLRKACKELGITERTYYRWVGLHKEHGSYVNSSCELH